MLVTSGDRQVCGATAMAKEWVFVIWLALAGIFPPPSTAAEKRLLCMKQVSNVEFTRGQTAALWYFVIYGVEISLVKRTEFSRANLEEFRGRCRLGSKAVARNGRLGNGSCRLRA
jgi:hypothetical protein